MHDTAPEHSISHRQAIFACATIIGGTVLLLSGIDLVLPSVPAMPTIFGTDIATVQLVLAAYVAGSGAGLLLFGMLAAHYGRRRLFIASLTAFGLFSLMAAFVDSIWPLIGLRLLQGAAASGAAVLAPGLIRALFSEIGAMRAIGAMGSIEALVPGLAPIAGAWLYQHYDWQASFTVTGTLAVAVGLVALLVPSLLPSVGRKKHKDVAHGYRRLMANRVYIRYALSHALVLAGLLTFVFTAPAVIIETMGGTIDDFIVMQFTGVCMFIVSANSAGSFVKRFGAEAVIMAGTVIALLGALLLFGYALFGPNDPGHLMYLFWLLNTGLGVRGGPGFVRALAAAHGDDDRASALLLLAVMALSAACTALVAPFIPQGLPALTIAVVAIILPALVIMLVLPRLHMPAEQTPQPANPQEP